MNDLSVAYWCDRRLRHWPYRSRRAVRFVAVWSWYGWARSRDAVLHATWPVRYPEIWLRVRLLRRLWDAGMDRQCAVDRVQGMSLEVVARHVCGEACGRLVAACVRR